MLTDEDKFEYLDDDKVVDFLDQNDTVHVNHKQFIVIAIFG